MEQQTGPGPEAQKNEGRFFDNFRRGVEVSAAVGAGALLLQDDPEAADWVVTLGVLGAFTPLHVRMLGGRPGRA